MLVEVDTVEIAGHMVLLEDKFLLRQKEDARKCNLLPWNLVPRVPAHGDHKLTNLMKALMRVNS
jgi:hypothetical protein